MALIYKYYIQKEVLSITGEIGLKVNKVVFDKDMVEPYNERNTVYRYIDLDIWSDKDVFHICGENDWGYLVIEALLPLLRYAQDVLKSIDTMLQACTEAPEVIILGKNEYRAVDILHRIRGLGDEIETYKSIPVVRSNTKDNQIKLLGNNEELNPFIPF